MEQVKYQVKDRICFITLNRPDKRNALSPLMVEELKTSFDQAEADPDVKVIVLNAEGETFCAGADLAYLRQLQNNTYEENLEDSKKLMNLFLKIYSLKKIVIAQVQGHALAGGCGLVTVCDFVFAVEEANFGYTEVKIGFVPAIVMIFLVRKLGEARARHLLLSGSQIKAKDAYSQGLINCVSHRRLLQKDVLEYAQYIIRTNSSESLMLTKQMLSQISSMPLEEVLNYAAEINAKARASADCKRGISAFLDKVKIHW